MKMQIFTEFSDFVGRKCVFQQWFVSMEGSQHQSSHFWWRLSVTTGSAGTKCGRLAVTWFWGKFDCSRAKACTTEYFEVTDRSVSLFHGVASYIYILTNQPTNSTGLWNPCPEPSNFELVETVLCLEDKQKALSAMELATRQKRKEKAQQAAAAASSGSTSPSESSSSSASSSHRPHLA